LKFSTALKDFVRPPQSIPTARSQNREESPWSDNEEEEEESPWSDNEEEEEEESPWSDSEEEEEDSVAPVEIQTDLAELEVERSNEDEFWAQGLMHSGTTEQTRHEMNVFRRVHLESRGGFFMNTGSISKFPLDTHLTQYVRSKFPQADEYLVERIGKAMSRRHHYLNYRKLRHDKLTGNADANSPNWSSHTENLNTKMSLPKAFKSGWGGMQPRSFTIGFIVGLPVPQGVLTRKNFRCLLCNRFIYCENSKAWRQVHFLRGKHV
jgi:hypothetical protein